MAKIEKDTKKPVPQATEKFKPWLENKIEEARRVLKPRAARASRYGAPAGVALIIFLISLSFFLPKNQFQKAKERLARNPNDSEAHLVLAEEYLKNNQIEKAEEELLLAQESIQYPVSSIQFDEFWQRMRESKPEDIKKLIEYWEKIVAEKPDYRDGYLRLALFHYKLYENRKAKEYLKKAIELDPNYESTRELERKIR